MKTKNTFMNIKVMTFGKYQGRKIMDLPSNYVDWMVRTEAYLTLPKDRMLSFLNRLEAVKNEVDANHSVKELIAEIGIIRSIN
jgi:uncharacterized protein (DUF3820 family)